ncbi:lysylphosphatidylglycerol synthase transmembrane domain-containing protein [Streptomyces camelliae]|uniref:Lysylphosphatidylglycerol synthase transmembrane domain-containing protein n=1 Tax=Streptomyces camelliae TaxID=3004093 RepID=A0ABY7PBF3_9ACTN|nr:lysylphosphatidylglycerol synthase transmembrane domain-containing protein [Streptomyces sp. HUAS 2-6]WBO67717.1 lysylphosphatidylglycerol synthase transmembrane domain-containing protein [Streptomyces sp. HUAS 2-6]
MSAPSPSPLSLPAAPPVREGALSSLAEATPSPRPASFLAGRPVRLALCLAPLLLAGGWAMANRPLVYEGVRRLVAADPWWLLAGGGFTCLNWVAAACVRQGALPDRLPAGQLLASQFAAGAANHALPGGLGAHAVTVRFLRARGVPPARAAASVGLYSLAKSSAKTVVLVVFLAVSPAWRDLGGLVPDGRLLVPVAAVVGGALAVAGVLLTVVRPLRRPVTGMLRCALADAREVHTRPCRVAALWGGAVAMPLLQAAALACVGTSLGLELPWEQVMLAHLAAGTAVGAVPAPGGLAVDAALVWTLIAFGSAPSVATATVIGYRVLTDWAPLAPGAVVLSALIRAKIL